MKDKIEKISDEALNGLINEAIRQSVGSFIDGSELSEAREEAIDYYTQQPKGRLAPMGVSKVVTSDTIEIVDSYLAVISELMLSNNKIAKFNAMDPTQSRAAGIASDITNHCIFTKNNGWTELNTWVKSALLFKNSVIRWQWDEKFEYKVEEYENVNAEEVDALVSEDDVEIIEMVTSSEMVDNEMVEFYALVKIRRKMDKSRIKLENIPPESFMIDRSATTIKDSTFVGIQTEMTLSDLREMGFDVDASLAEGGQDFTTINGVNGEDYNRQSINGIWENSEAEGIGEANTLITVSEVWMRIDRDGDGIAELKRFIVAGEEILLEEYADSIPLADLNPIEIPYTFYGLSIADATKSATEIKTAITRGLIENVYLTNYGRILADPNVVDFRALQSPEPHQIIPTNGSPVAAVQPITPDNLSPSTFSLLEFMNKEKEQATGMTRAAQGVNEKLFDSGNSAGKVAQVQAASQKRIAYIARRFAETGFKDMCKGVYELVLNNADSVLKDYAYYGVTSEDLMPLDNVTVDIDVGTNSSANTQDNMMMLASQVMPMLYQSPETKSVINPNSGFNIAKQLMESMGIENWSDFIVDPNTPQGQQQQEAVSQQGQAEAEEARKEGEIEQQKLMLTLQKQMADIQKKQADMELDREKFEHQKAKDRAEVALEAASGRPTKIG